MANYLHPVSLAGEKQPLSSCPKSQEDAFVPDDLGSGARAANRTSRNRIT